MARLGRDYAFDIREIKRLQEVGVKTLETAEETGRDQEASISRLNACINSLPSRVSTRVIENTLDRMRGTMVAEEYRNSRELLRRTTEKLLETIPRTDREMAECVDDLSQRAKKLEQKMQSILLLVGEDSPTISVSEFQQRLIQDTGIWDREEITRYIEIVDGRYLYHWVEIREAMTKANLTEPKMETLLEVLTRMGQEKSSQREDLMKAMVKYCATMDEEGHRGAANLGLLSEYNSQHIKKAGMKGQKEPGLFLAGVVEKIDRGLYPSETIRMPGDEVVDYTPPYVDKWLSTDYKMNAEEIKQARWLIDDYYENEYRNTIAYRDGVMDKSDELKLIKITALETKISKGGSWTAGLYNGIPLVSQGMNWLGDYMEDRFNIEVNPLSRFDTISGNAEVQYPWYETGGEITAQIGTYTAASLLLLSIPGVGGAIGKAGVSLSKLPFLAWVGAGSITNVMSDTAVDVVLRTLPELYEDIKSGKGWKEIAKSTILSVSENVLWNIGAEGALTAGKKVFDIWFDSWFNKGSQEALEDAVKGGSGAVNGIKGEVIKTSPADEVNNWWKTEMGYDNPPYKPGTSVSEIKLTQETTFVRVYDGDTSGQFGGWVMKADDIKGLTPIQIQNKFALPATPVYVTDVKLPAGTTLRTGIVNPLEGWGAGGGIQFDLMGQRIGEFVNPRLLP